MTESSAMTAERFRSIRERAGYATPAALAERVRLTKRQIQLIEAGRRKPGGPLTVLMELLDAGRL